MKDLVIEAVLVEDDEPMSLQEFARACRAKEELIEAMIDSDILQVLDTDTSADKYQLPTRLLSRSRRALRLHHDLDINWSGVALALDLLDRLEALEQELKKHQIVY